MRRLLGIDLAITPENQACLVDETGGVLEERWFRLTRDELEALWEASTEGLGNTTRWP